MPSINTVLNEGRNVLRRLRRPAALLAPLLLLSTLAACGSETSSTGIETADRLDAVTIEGDVGETPTIDWKDRMSAGEPETSTLVEGTGAALAKGDTVFVNFLLGNGYTRTSSIDTFGADEAGVQITIGGEAAQPASLSDVVKTYLAGEITEGITRGTRLAITANASDLLGQAVFSSPVAAAGIGNEDGLLIVADILDTEVLEGPEGALEPAQSWAPTIEFKAGIPTGLDFKNTPAPNKQLRTAILKKGTGDPVEDGDLLTVNYLGQLADAEKPFDESFSTQAFPTPIGLNAVVKGWDQALVGLPVGSRVILQIPPALGYGKEGSGETIPGDSTLYFIVDILASI